MSVSRFMLKRASLASIFPAVAGPALGGYIGHELFGNLGGLVGGIMGGTGGKYLAERISDAEDAKEESSPYPTQPVPMGYPYDIDPTSPNLPDWAVQGAQYIHPYMKQAAEHESPWDVVLGEVPGLPVLQSGLSHGPLGAAKTFGAMSLGGGAGALAGLGAGKGIEYLLGHGKPINVPGINMSLSDILAGLGGTLGATKAMRYART